MDGAERTTIVNRSDDVTTAAYESVTFYCVAVSDDSTVVTYRWYFGDDSLPLVIDNHTYHYGDSQLMIDTQSDGDGGVQRAGLYRCAADNGYSVDIANIQLSVTSQSVCLPLFSSIRFSATFICNKLDERI